MDHGKQYTFIVSGVLPSLNELINANRRNKFEGAQIKKDADAYIKQYIIAQNVPEFKKVRVDFNWYCKDMRIDPDNIASAKKFCLDSMVKCGVIPNDGWKNVSGFSDSFYIDKFNPRVEITLTEVI